MKDYTKGSVTYLLDVYLQIENGRLPQGERSDVQKSSETPTFQLACEAHADIYRALKHLSDRERYVVHLLHIDGYSMQEIAGYLSLSSLDVSVIDDEAICKMVKFLNTGK